MSYEWRLLASVLTFLGVLWGFGLVFAAVYYQGNPRPYIRWTGRTIRRFLSWLFFFLWDTIAWLFHRVIRIATTYPTQLLFLILGVLAGVGIGYYLWCP